MAKSHPQEVPDVAADIRTYSTGRYGLVDLYYRHIWFNHWNEAIVHQVSRAFWTKATTVVFDLSWFDNYSDQDIDTDVCLNWKIPVCTNLDSLMLKLSLKNTVLFDTQTQYESKLLLNEPTACNLTPQQQLDLQRQMLLMVSVLESTYLYCSEYSTPQREALLTDISNIFLTEIRLDEIHKQLYELAGARIESPNDASVKILELLGKLYA